MSESFPILPSLVSLLETHRFVSGFSDVEAMGDTNQTYSGIFGCSSKVSRIYLSYKLREGT